MPAWTPNLFRYLRGAAAVVLQGRGRYFDSCGVPIRFFERGVGEAVVLIHGFSRAASTWAASGIAADLAKEYRVVTLDCRGHGRSGKPAGPAAYGACMVDDVVRLLDHLGIDAAHVVGHSMGGRIALRLAASRPERIRSAVLIASGGMLTSAQDSDPMPIDRVAESLERGDGLGPLLKAILPPHRTLSRWRLRLLDRAALVTNDPQALAAVVRGYAGLAVTDAELASFNVPVSAIVGSDDSYRSAVAALARRIPGLEAIIVEGATHLDVLRRSETRSAIKSFLAACPKERRKAA